MKYLRKERIGNNCLGDNLILYNMKSEMCIIVIWFVFIDIP